jgi:hypothetical protein
VQTLLPLGHTPLLGVAYLPFYLSKEYLVIWLNLENL